MEIGRNRDSVGDYSRMDGSRNEKIPSGKLERDVKCPDCGQRISAVTRADDWGSFFFWLDGGIKVGAVLAVLLAPFSLLLAIVIGVAVVVIYALMSLPSQSSHKVCKNCRGGHE